MEMTSPFFLHVCSRNPIARWALGNALASYSSNWSVICSSSTLLPIAARGHHILLIDACSMPEWPETVRKWSGAGYQTILLVAENWGTRGAELRALHLGVRGIVHVRPDFIPQLSEAINLVTGGQLFASQESLNQFYSGRLRPRSASSELSFREEQVRDLLLEGFSNKRIGSVLGISERTAKFHVCNILRKLQVTNRRELTNKNRNGFELYKSA
jgi:DNA-binding NarL/FixJ family response regulator